MDRFGSLCRFAASDGNSAHRIRDGRFPSPSEWL